MQGQHVHQGGRFARPRLWLVVAGAGAALALGIPLGALGQGVTKDQQRNAAKRAALQQEAQAVATAQAAPRPAKNAAKPVTAPTPQPAALRAHMPRVPAGAGFLVETQLAPFPSSVFAAENAWFERNGDEVVVVYAGVDTQDPAQGRVRVHVTSPAGETGGSYATPTKSGSVRITAAVGERLTLTSRSGAVFYFDVPTRTFIATAR